MIGGEILKAEASATLDSSYGFYDAAPPQQNAGAADAPAGELATAIVELIFTE